MTRKRTADLQIDNNLSQIHSAPPPLRLLMNIIMISHRHIETIRRCVRGEQKISTNELVIHTFDVIFLKREIECRIY